MPFGQTELSNEGNLPYLGHSRVTIIVLARYKWFPIALYKSNYCRVGLFFVGK